MSSLFPDPPRRRKRRKPKLAAPQALPRPAQPARTSEPPTTLAETLRRIAAMGFVAPPARVRPPRHPTGASFRSATYSDGQGALRYKLYIPASAATSEAPMPLLVMMHGCGQTPDDFARGTGMNRLAEEYRLIVAWPAQETEANRNRCWNWFRRGNQGRDAGEPALIAGLVRRILATQRVDPARVYIAGLSAGASAALVIASAYPDLFAAAGAHSGLPAGAAHDAASGLLAMRYGAPGTRPSVRMPTIVFHGDADRVVHPRNGRYVAIRALAPFPELRSSVATGTSPGGRRFVRTVHRAGRGRPLVEHWLVLGSGHAWSGGDPAGTFTDPAGPDASRAMVRFFLRHRLARRRRSATAARQP